VMPTPDPEDDEGRLMAYYRKLVTSLPEEKRAAAARTLDLFEQETQWHGFTDVMWLGLCPAADWNRQYGPVLHVPRLQHAHAVEVRAKSRGLSCTVWRCKCPGDCGCYLVMPTALYKADG